MKKLELKFGSVKEMLTKEQMKQISGGDAYLCYLPGTGGGTYTTGPVDNCCQAQAECDYRAWSNSYSSSMPQGCDCPCDMDC